MLYGRSRSSKANGEDLDRISSKACRPVAVSIEMPGKIDRPIALIVGYARDEAVARALEIRS
jgi:hypothetical protein